CVVLPLSPFRARTRRSASRPNGLVGPSFTLALSRQRGATKHALSESRAADTPTRPRADTPRHADTPVSRVALIVDRQRELKDSASGWICRRRKPSSMRFDNRTANRQPHAKALRLGRVEGVEKTAKIVRIEARAGISHRNQYVGPFSFVHGLLTKPVLSRF